MTSNSNTPPSTTTGSTTGMSSTTGSTTGGSAATTARPSTTAKKATKKPAKKTARKTTKSTARKTTASSRRKTTAKKATTAKTTTSRTQQSGSTYKSAASSAQRTASAYEAAYKNAAQQASTAASQTANQIFSAGIEAMNTIMSAFQPGFEAGRGAAENTYQQATKTAQAQMEQASRQFFAFYEEMSNYGRDNAAAINEASNSVARAMEDLGRTAINFAQQSIEANVSATKALVGCKNAKEALDVQADWAKSRLDSFLMESNRLSDMSVQLANQAIEPIQEQANESVQRFFRAVK